MKKLRAFTAGILSVCLVISYATVSFAQEQSTKDVSVRKKGGYTSTDIFPYHLASIYFKDLPDSGKTKLTFPIKVDKMPVNEGYYFHGDVYFDDGKIAYIGVQSSSDGKNRLNTRYAFFGKGSSLGESEKNAECNDRADGGDGTECDGTHSYKPGNTYYLTLMKSDAKVASGKVRWEGRISSDPQKTGKLIASIDIPESSGNIKKAMAVFEYFDDIPSCDKLPSAEVTYLMPFGSDKKAMTLQEVQREDMNGAPSKNECNGQSGSKGLSKIQINKNNDSVQIIRDIKNN